MFVKYAEITIKAVPAEHIHIDEADGMALADAIFSDPTIEQLTEAIKVRLQGIIPSSFEPVVTISGTKKGYAAQDNDNLDVKFNYYPVNHTRGYWPVRSTIGNGLNEAKYLALVKGKTKATDASFKSRGLAIGWIKRLARNSPTTTDKFLVIKFAGAPTWDIYFE